jgi:hypothetical protein
MIPRFRQRPRGKGERIALPPFKLGLGQTMVLLRIVGKPHVVPSVILAHHIMVNERLVPLHARDVRKANLKKVPASSVAFWWRSKQVTSDGTAELPHNFVAHNKERFFSVQTNRSVAATVDPEESRQLLPIDPGGEWTESRSENADLRIGE